MQVPIMFENFILHDCFSYLLRWITKHCTVMGRRKPTRCYTMFYCTCSAQHVSGTFMPITRSWRLHC